MKLSYENVKKYFLEQGCVLLSNEYVNAHILLDYKCNCGSLSAINWNNFKYGKRCKKCGIEKQASQQRHNFEYVKNYFKEHGCELLEEEYKNSLMLLIYRCECNNIAKIRFSDFKRGDRCRSCRYKKTANKLKLDYDYVKQYFIDNGCELLDKEYKNARTHLNYRCICGNKSNIVFDSFKRGNRCKQCWKQKRKLVVVTKPNKPIILIPIKNKSHYKNTYDYNYIKQYFYDKGCELLETIYVNSQTLMQYKCVCGSLSKISFNNFRSGRRCKNCLKISRTGPNNYQWRSDREQLKLELKFKDKCHKALTVALRVSGERKSGRRTRDLLGYDWRDLKKHIENYPTYDEVKNDKWHIDHIFPIKAFLDYNIWDVKVINSLDNLQPLLGSYNGSKGSKYDKGKFEEYLENKSINSGIKNNNWESKWIDSRTYLTHEDIVDIREMRQQGLTLNQIASKYNAHYSTISLICKNKTWKNI